MEKIVCARCNSDNVEIKIWVSANELEPTDSLLNLKNITEKDSFCRDCYCRILKYKENEKRKEN